MDEELQQARAAKWRLDGRPVDARRRAGVHRVGRVLPDVSNSPERAGADIIGAWVGEDDHLPTQQHAYADARAKEAMAMMVRVLRAKAAFEAPLVDESNPFLLSPAVFPFYYALVGDRNPKVPPKAGPRSNIRNLPAMHFRSSAWADFETKTRRDAGRRTVVIGFGPRSARTLGQAAHYAGRL